MTAGPRRPPAARGPRSLGDLVDRLAASGLLGAAPATGVAGRVVSSRVTEDSRRVTAGSVFVAVPGLRTDGHDYAVAAAGAGAAALLVERPVPMPGGEPPQVVVTNARRALAEAAAWWYGDPSTALGIVGVTGTDGKTTTSHLAVAALVAAGIPTGLVSTVASRVGGRTQANAVHATTPSAPELQALLAAMVEAGDRAAVVETTSHGLALDRVASIAYDIAIFTNLSHEHLDLHGTFEAYRAAKASLFERLGSATAVKAAPAPAWDPTGIVNVDDANAEVFARTTLDAGARLLRVSAAGAEADVRALGVADEPDGLRVRYLAPSGEGEVRSSLRGRVNVPNLLEAVALGEAVGADPALVREGLAAVRRVTGRMEWVRSGQPFEVVVDFAHSPASLELLLDELGSRAAAAGGGLIAVFGSAGDRDVAKRPLMGRIAGARCRLVVLTDEDPRGEDRQAILDEIAAGAESTGRVRGRDLLLIADRRAAIRAALAAARPGDIVALAGKGHETTIERHDRVEAWNELAEVAAALADLGWSDPDPARRG